MISSELQGMNYFTHENYSTFNFDNLVQSNLQALHSTRFQANLPNNPTTFPPQEFSSGSTSDEADVTNHQLTITDHRKQRRMISNRESARRSRMRKQKHFDELWSQVLRLKADNDNLIEKLNNFSKSHDEVVQENVRLKEETSDLRQMVSDLQVGDSYSIFRDLGEIPCNKEEKDGYPFTLFCMSTV